jgi:hypothetical protein
MPHLCQPPRVSLTRSQLFPLTILYRCPDRNWRSVRKVFDEELGRPSIPPGVYFRMLLVGYFEGVASENRIACHCADSLSLRWRSDRLRCAR